MTAPAAPVITFRAADIGTLRLRWASVTAATSYKVYVAAVLRSTVTDTNATVYCSPNDAITVTALNAGLEESVPSNTITVGGMGTNNSFPQGKPRGPYTGPFG